MLRWPPLLVLSKRPYRLVAFVINMNWTGTERNWVGYDSNNPEKAKREDPRGKDPRTCSRILRKCKSHNPNHNRSPKNLRFLRR